MAEDLELDLDLEDPNINRTEERIKKLSSTVRTVATERDEANAKAETEATARLAAEKERDFYASFSTNTSKFPAASEHIDAIKEKVLAGYSVEDATVSVLNAEGKLMPQAEIAPNVDSGIGGSAATPSLNTADKPVGEMSREEKRTALLEADKRGEVAEALRSF